MTTREIIAETASCMSVALIAEGLVMVFIIGTAIVLVGLRSGAI